jgi:hypothetical protein
MIESVGGKTHEGPQGDELAGGLDERRQHRPDAEGGEPDDQEQPPAVSVGESSGHEEQSGEHQRVGVHHPLQLARVGPEVAG